MGWMGSGSELFHALRVFGADTDKVPYPADTGFGMCRGCGGDGLVEITE